MRLLIVFFSFCLLLSFPLHSLLHRSPLCCSIPLSTTHLFHFPCPTTQSFRTKTLRNHSIHILCGFIKACVLNQHLQIPQTQQPCRNIMTYYVTQVISGHGLEIFVVIATNEEILRYISLVSPFDRSFSNNLLSHRHT